MYDKELEKLIDAVIADGIITDQERKVVYKKAASLGIDQDEIEVYLNGRLDSFNASNKTVSNKQGAILTCPNCGASVGALDTKCSECGYEFKNTKVSDSVQGFAKKYMKASLEKKLDLITSYPIPNDKENIVEFLALSSSQSSNSIFSSKAIKILLIIFGAIAICAWIGALGNFNGEDAKVFLGCVSFIFLLLVVWLPFIFMDNQNDKYGTREKHLKRDIEKAWSSKVDHIYTKTTLMNFNEQERNNLNRIFSKHRKSKRIPIFLIILEIILIGIAALVWFNASSSLYSEYQQWLSENTPQIEEYAQELNDELDELPIPTSKNYKECISDFNEINWTKEWPIPEQFKKLTKDRSLDEHLHEKFAERKSKYALQIGAAWKTDLKSKGIEDTSGLIPDEFKFRMYQDY